MAQGRGLTVKKDKMLKVAFILYMVSVAASIAMLYESLSVSGSVFRINVRNADLWANMLRIIADIMILAGFWKTRRNALLMWGFLINIIPQALDLLVHFRDMRDSIIPSLAFVATVFLIVFYTVLTGIVVTDARRESAYLFAKIAVLTCLFFWLISDISNLVSHGMEGVFTIIFLLVDLTQMITLGIWGFLFTDLLNGQE
ncbi:MAG: hypothetical protein J6W36_09335 [Clostridiales bacterium]|nr:hypothetical protein [Clostridiales bacterium]